MHELEERGVQSLYNSDLGREVIWSVGPSSLQRMEIIDITGDSDEDGMIVSTKTKGKPTQSTLNIDNYS